MNPRATHDYVVGRRTVQDEEMCVQVDAFRVDWKGDLSQSVLVFSTKSYKDCGATHDVTLVNMHLFQRAEEEYIC